MLLQRKSIPFRHKGDTINTTETTNSLISNRLQKPQFLRIFASKHVSAQDMAILRALNRQSFLFLSPTKHHHSAHYLLHAGQAAAGLFAAIAIHAKTIPARKGRLKA